MPSITKINRPHLAGIVRRERLFRLLDKRMEKSITWICASPGSGKTTLTADYLDAKKLPCLWYQVDEGDSDPATFFYYMGMAAGKAMPRRKKRLPLLTPEYFHAVPSFAKRYFEALFHGLSPTAPASPGKGRSVKKLPPKPFVMVFDNYQDASGPAFQEMMNAGMDIVPDGIRVIILSRQEPPPQFARLRASDKIGLLGWDEIKFTMEESEEFLKSKKKTDLPADSIKNLHDRADGWAAGLLLMAEGASSREMGAILPKTQREVFEYFAGEIFNKTDKTVQEVLLKTAFLHKIDPETAEKLTEVDSAGKILEYLKRKNYFTQRYTDGYQYHPLFRGFLLATARETFTAREISVTQQRAALLLEERGQADEAVGLYLEARDWDSAMRLILRHAPEWISQGRSKSLEEWIRSIPDDLTETSPWLLYWLGICRLAYNPVEARGYFEKAYPIFKEEEDVSGLFLAWAAIMDTFVYAWSDFRPMGAWIGELEAMARKHPVFPSPDIEARVVSGMFNALLWRQPLHPDLPAWAERLNRIVLGDAGLSLRTALGNSLALYYTWMGDFAKGTLIVDALSQAGGKLGADPLVMLGWHGMKAMHAWLVADHDACLSSIAHGMALGEETGVHLLDFFLFAQGIYSGISQGDLASAKDFLDKIARLNSIRALDKSLYHYMAAAVAWYQGDFTLSIEHGNQALSFSEDTACPFTVALCRIDRSLTLFDMKRYKEAEEDLTHALSLARGLTHVEFLCRVFRAWFSLELGDEAKGIAELRLAFAIGARQNYVNFTRWRPEMMSFLCAKALEQGIETDYALSLIKTRNLTPPAKSSLSGIWPYPVKIYTLGGFKIVKDGKPVEFSGKAPQRPLDLLKALITLGGVNVNFEQLADVLWPDADGDLAYQSFEAALHRLRKLMGNDKMLQRQGGAIAIDRRYCWLDIWAFDELNEEMEAFMERREEKEDASPDGDDIKLAASLAGRVFALYKGKYLAGDSEKTWMIAYRERLRNRFIHLASKLGNYLARGKEFEKAIDCYRGILDTDPTLEEFYQRIMVCCQGAGNPALGISFYKQCRRVLFSSLGVAPSPKTEEIYKTLL